MPPDPLQPILDAQGVLVLDGGLATELEARGADLGDALWSARLLRDDPASIRAVHDAYLAAGADCLIAATYQATVAGFRAHGGSVAEAEALIGRGVTIARAARDAFWSVPTNRRGRSRPLVAASVGPYGAAQADGSEYTGRYDVDRGGLEAFHRRRLGLLSAAGPDLVACETIPSRIEAEVLVSLLAAPPEGRPVAAWLSFSCRDAGHLADGTPLEDAVATAAACPAIVAIGVNCVAPHLVPGLVSRLRIASDRPIVVYPNSGESWDAVQRCWQGEGSPGDFAAAAVSWVAAGVAMIGGCCRTGPAHIRSVRRRLGLRPGGRIDGRRDR